MYFLYERIIKKKKKYINAGERGKFSHWPNTGRIKERKRSRFEIKSNRHTCVRTIILTILRYFQVLVMGHYRIAYIKAGRYLAAVERGVFTHSRLI